MNAALAGLHIAVTRAHTQSEEICAALRALGAVPILFPLIEIIPPVDWAPVDAAVRAASGYDWIVFTSANAVHSFLKRMTGNEARDSVRVAAIGPATAGALREYGVTPDLVADRHVAEVLAEAMKGQGLAGTRVLLPQGDLARDTVARQLGGAGAHVDVVVCYRNVPAQPDVAPFLRSLMRGEVNWILLFSPSAVHNLFHLLDGEWYTRTRLASIGPTTSRAIREHGVEPTIEASSQTAQSLLDALSEYHQRKETHPRGDN